MADEIDLNLLGEQIRRLQADMHDLKSRSARTDADVLALNEHVASVAERLESLERRSVIGFDAVDKGFDSVDRRFDYVYQRFERIDVELAALRAEMAEMRAENSRNLEIILTAIGEQRG
jgi:chromosome segregation ATPase